MNDQYPCCGRQAISNDADRSIFAPSPYGEGWGGALDRSIFAPSPCGEGWGGALERLVIAVLLLLLLALAPAMAQTVVRTGETTPLSVEVKPGIYDTFGWELYKDSTVNFAVTPGDVLPAYAEFVGGIDDGPTVNVLWKLPGTYFFKVTATDVAGCTVNLKIGMIKVLLAVKAEITPPDTAGVCIGLPVSLEVTLTGTAPWSFTYTDGITYWDVTGVTDAQNPYIIWLDPKPASTTDYWISKVSDIYGTNLVPSDKVTQKIYPLPDPSTIIHR